MAHAGGAAGVTGGVDVEVPSIPAAEVSEVAMAFSGLFGRK